MSEVTNPGGQGDLTLDNGWARGKSTAHCRMSRRELKSFHVLEATENAANSAMIFIMRGKSPAEVVARLKSHHIGYEIRVMSKALDLAIEKGFSKDRAREFLREYKNLNLSDDFPE